MQKPPLAKLSWPAATSLRVWVWVASDCSRHHRWKNACSTYLVRKTTTQPKAEKKKLSTTAPAHQRHGRTRNNARELALRIRPQLLDDGIDNVPHSGMLDRVVGARIVLVDGFQPADIVVRVGHQVNLEAGNRQATHQEQGQEVQHELAPNKK